MLWFPFLSTAPMTAVLSVPRPRFDIPLWRGFPPIWVSSISTRPFNSSPCSVAIAFLILFWILKAVGCLSPISLEIWWLLSLFLAFNISGKTANPLGSSKWVWWKIVPTVTEYDFLQLEHCHLDCLDFSLWRLTLSLSQYGHFEWSRHLTSSSRVRHLSCVPYFLSFERY